MGYAVSGIKGVRGAVMITRGGKWVATVCAWMTGGKMPTLQDARAIVETETKHEARTVQPINAQTWPEGHAVACFLVCAMVRAQEMADRMTHGHMFHTAERAYAHAVDTDTVQLKNAFTQAYLSRLARVYPHGVPVLTSGIIRTKGRDADKTRCIVGVGLIA